MDWEKSRAVTALKRDLLRAFFEKSQAFYLTGGSALGIFYLQHRISYDLDLFTDQEIDWHLLENTMLDVSRSIGAKCTTITASPLFFRFEVSRERDREIVDFVIERIPQIDKEKMQVGDIRVDTLREIGVNKICTLVSRCDLKDVIDLYFLEKNGFDILEHFHLARQKEGGLEPAMISFLLSQLDVDHIPEYLLTDIDLRDLQSFISRLRETMSNMAFPG